MALPAIIVRNLENDFQKLFLEKDLQLFSQNFEFFSAKIIEYGKTLKRAKVIEHLKLFNEDISKDLHIINLVMLLPLLVKPIIVKKKKGSGSWKPSSTEISEGFIIHAKLPNDMKNYMKYHLMGSVSQVRMKPGCIPTKFVRQPDRKTGTSVERQYIRKKRKMMAIEECEKQLEESNRVTEHFDFEDIASGSSVQHNLEEAQHVTSKMIDKSIQVHMTKTFRSKGNQIGVRLINQMTSSLKPQLHSASTSPFKIKHNVNSNPSILTEQSDSDISYTPSHRIITINKIASNGICF
ncbi:hypothetical protein FQA39_LY06491 [Lamprigera yunnana]|nr:hypothetical protein FQA39_LY06491 [Lamprigera yunnana]